MKVEMESNGRRRSSIVSLRRASIDSLRNLKNLLPTHRRKSSVHVSYDFDNVQDRHNLISTIRGRVLNEINEAGLLFDTRDIDRVKQDDQFLLRFATEKVKDIGTSGDVVSVTVQSVINCLRWRKQLGVNDLKAEDFPEEIYKSGICSFTEHGGESGHGEVTVFICARRYKKIDGCTDLIIKFVVFCLETIEKR